MSGKDTEGHSDEITMYPMNWPIKALATMAARGLGLAWLLFAASGLQAAGLEAAVTVTVTQTGEMFVVDALSEVPVSLAGVWEVLTDFDHMALFISNLKSSEVTRRDGNTWWVRQEGVAHYGPLSLPFKSEREVRLEPKKRILARSLSGSAKRMESEARIGQAGERVRIHYHAEIVPDSGLARMFGATVVRHEIEEQFREMTAEMLRRYPPAE